MKDKSISIVPKYSQLIVPTFVALKKFKNNEGSNSEIVKQIISDLSISEEIANIPHGNNPKETEISYRAGWARTYLRMYGVITSTSRSRWKITDAYATVNPLDLDVDDIVKKVKVYSKQITPSVKKQKTENKTIDATSSVVDDETPEEKTEHTFAQWLLIKIGRLAGCDTFIASNDGKKKYKNDVLSELCINDIPKKGMDEKTYKRAKLIDVLWVNNKKEIVCAFEVECTTSIYSGILRMSDLAYSMPYDKIQCFIVAPESRTEKVIEQLLRPTFSNENIKLNNITIESLKILYDKIKDFNPGSVSWKIIESSINNIEQTIDN